MNSLLRRTIAPLYRYIVMSLCRYAVVLRRSRNPDIPKYEGSSGPFCLCAVVPLPYTML